MAGLLHRVLTDPVLPTPGGPAMDLDIPLIGIGLFYGQGYFRQHLDKNLWQEEEYLQTDLSQLPMELAIGTSGQPVNVQIETRSGCIRAKVWRVKVGRCDLLLLDSNVEGNAPEDRELTSRLYGGDGRIRRTPPARGQAGSADDGCDDHGRDPAHPHTATLR